MDYPILQELIKDGSLNEWREEIKQEVIKKITKEDIMTKMKDYIQNHPSEIDVLNRRKSITQLFSVFNKEMMKPIKQDIESIFDDKIKDQLTCKILQNILKETDSVPNGKIDNGVIYVNNKIYDPNSDGWKLEINREGKLTKLKDLF